MWHPSIFGAIFCAFLASTSGLLQSRIKRQSGVLETSSGIAAGVGKADLEALKSELEYMIHENFLELEAKTEVFLQRQIKEKYEKKFERTMEEMAEQIFNLTNEVDGLNRRCSCIRGGAGGGGGGGGVPSSDAWERDIRRRAQFACNNMAVTASNSSYHGGKVFGLCDNNGWLAFHRSYGTSDLFTSKNWAQYRHGFGQAGGNSPAEFWLGLEALNRITRANSRFQLMIRGSFKNDESNGDYAGKNGWIVYDEFSIDDEERNYAIHIGPIVDHHGFSRVTEFDPIHDVTQNPERKLDGSAFSTWDSDNDLTSANCADTYHNVGWWFNACYHVCFTQKNPFWFDGEKLQYFEKVEMLVRDVGGSAPNGRK